jgi:hypothetical protein
MYDVELYHHGIKGQRWGVRRYQNRDGTLTKAGLKRNSKLHNLKENYLYEKRDNPGLKRAAKAEIDRGRLHGKSDRQSVLDVEERAVEKMENIANLAKVMRDYDPKAEDPDFKDAYKYIQREKAAAFRGYQYLATEMSKQAGIYSKPLSDSDLKRAEDLGRRWEKAYDGDMYEFDAHFLPSEMKKKFDL